MDVNGSPAAYEDVSDFMGSSKDLTLRDKVVQFIEREQHLHNEKKEMPVKNYRSMIPLMVLYSYSGKHKTYKKRLLLLLKICE